jgi:hypothetical protein
MGTTIIVSVVVPVIDAVIFEVMLTDRRTLAERKLGANPTHSPEEDDHTDMREYSRYHEGTCCIGEVT